MSATRTVCPLCGFGCVIYIDKETGAVSGGSCAKRALAVELLGRNRLFYPLARVGEGFREVSWSTAVGSIASELRKILRVYGGDAVAFLGCSKCSNEENYLLQKLARLAGSNNIDNCARLCHAVSVRVLARQLGLGAQTNPFYDLLYSRAIMILGYNPAATHPPLASLLQEARKRGSKLVVVDVRDSETTGIADVFVRLPGPGLDHVFLNCVAKAAILRGLYNREFVEEKTEGFDGFVESLEPYTPAICEEVLEIPWSTIEMVAEVFATAGTGSILWGMGVTQQPEGEKAVEAATNLALLLGYVGKRGCGLYPVRGQNNVQGACDMGALPEYLPGYASVVDSVARKRLEELWGFEGLPSEPGLSAVEVFEAASRGRIRALVIVGENPVVSHPDTATVEKALRNTELVVVSDVRPSETARYADYVIASAAWAEKEGSYTNSERRVRWSFKAFDPPGAAKPDWLFLSMLGEALGLRGWRRYGSPEEVLREINMAVPIYRGITPEKLKKTREGLTWPCSESPAKTLYTNSFATASGRAVLARASPPPAKKHNGFKLITYRLSKCYNTMPCLDGQESHPIIFINKTDAEELGITDNDEITIKTPCGEATFKAKTTEKIPRKTLATPWHTKTNKITCAQPLNTAKTPPLKNIVITDIHITKRNTNS